MTWEILPNKPHTNALTASPGTLSGDFQIEHQNKFFSVISVILTPQFKNVTKEIIKISLSKVENCIWFS
jgi:hypothetical protein